MPKPQPTRIPRGDELLTVNQALEFIAYGDLDRARKTQEIHISERAWSSRSVLAYMDPMIMDALGTLWRWFEDGTVKAIDRGGVVPAFHWGVDRLARLAPGEELALGPFVQELQRVIAHIRIPASELMAALSEPAPVAQPPVAQPPVAQPPVAQPPVALKPLTPRQREVKAALLDVYPDGSADTYDVMLDRLSIERKVTVGRATLVRVLPHMPEGWRKKR